MRNHGDLPPLVKVGIVLSICLRSFDGPYPRREWQQTGTHPQNLRAVADGGFGPVAIAALVKRSRTMTVSLGLQTAAHDHYLTLIQAAS